MAYCKFDISVDLSAMVDLYYSNILNIINTNRIINIPNI